MTEVTLQMAAEAHAKFVEALNDQEPCRRCEGQGYHHGFGEHGHDPDWCEVCGGSGFDQKYDEVTAMQMAITAALKTEQGK